MCYNIGTEHEQVCWELSPDALTDVEREALEEHIAKLLASQKNMDD